MEKARAEENTWVLLAEDQIGKDRVFTRLAAEGMTGCSDGDKWVRALSHTDRDRFGRGQNVITPVAVEEVRFRQKQQQNG